MIRGVLRQSWEGGEGRRGEGRGGGGGGGEVVPLAMLSGAVAHYQC